MKAFLFYLFFACFIQNSSAQSPKTELYDFIKKLLTDSTGYENVGDWAVGKPKMFPVKWKEDRIIMSEDTSINFYRMGIADIVINGQQIKAANAAIKWNIMLKGPRSGYSSFSILSSPSQDLMGKYTLDSLFGKKNCKIKLLKKCDTKPGFGYYYYEIKFPQKDIAYLKTSWVDINGLALLRIDCYDSYSKYAVKLDCAR